MAKTKQNNDEQAFEDVAVEDEAAVKESKIIKPKKKKIIDTSAQVIHTGRSILLQQSLAIARKEFGDKNICAAGDANKIVIGLPLPCLAFEYLIQNEVWPLGRFTQIVGKHGTCKSALIFEMVRWFQQSHGLAYLFENETKYSPDYALSIIGYPKTPDDEVLAHIPCHSVDDWQSKLQRMIGWCKEQMEKKEIGKKFPVLFAVDSLMGKLSAESQATIEKRGFADRAHPHEAMMINSFLKKIPQDIEEWPMCLVATNHLKPKKAETGNHIERHKAGGASPDFQETFELEMTRDASAKINLVDDEAFETAGMKLILACKKNSLGETDRKIKAEIRWVHRQDPDTGEYRQYTKWDWPAATVNLLNSFDAGHRREKIQEIVHIGGSGNKFYSKTFGITSTEPVSAHELGKLIEADPDIKQALRNLFGIKSRKVFDPTMDYDKQLAMLLKTAEQSMVQ